MYSRLTLARKYLQYYIRAANSKGHGIHSPFVFDLVTRVLNDKRKFYSFQFIEGLREKLLLDGTMLEVLDLGAGHSAAATKRRTIADITRRSAKSPKFGQLLFRMADHYQPRSILELGTSLGLSAAYLASAHPAAHLVTIEGSPAVAAVAKNNLATLGIRNAELRTGNFDDVLPEVLKEFPIVDFAFVDGNHREQPTLDYFHSLMPHRGNFSIFIFDDIHWSQGMERAWREIKRDDRVMLTVDLFFIGIVFLANDFKTKQHFTIRF